MKSSCEEVEDLLDKVNFSTMLVAFPFKLSLDDYHEGPHIAKILAKLTGTKILFEDIGFDDKTRKYVFFFHPERLVKEKEFSSFSRDKEAFIAP